MITADQARAAILSMPVVEETVLPTHSEFRVKGKLFARHWAGANLANLRVGAEEQAMLSSQARLYSIPREGVKGGWISVHLQNIPAAEFETAVWKAWANSAGPKLALQYS